jgi:hypothetical protein
MRASLKIGAALALGIASAALAFVMPAFAILKHVEESRDRLSIFTLRIEGTAAFHGAGVQEAGAALGLPTDRPEVLSDAVFSIKVPGRCRLELSPLEGQRAAVVENGGRGRVEGKELPVAQALLAPVCALLAVRSSGETGTAEAIGRYLQQRAVDKAASTWLARFGGDVAYVIGAKGEADSQLWVFKDSFLPARMKWTDAQSTSWDVRFYDYTSPATGEWFPRMLEVYRNNELQLRFTSQRADPKVAIADKLF